MKVRLTLHRAYGDIEIEAETFDEIVERLRAFPEWLDVIDSVVSAQASGANVKESLAGIIENTADESILNDKKAPEIHKIKPFIYDSATRKYHIVGDEIAKAYSQVKR